MAPLIFIILSLALLGGFLALVARERANGVRAFAPARAELDREVERATYIATHVDWNSYAEEQIRTLVIRVGHTLVHGSLLGVRYVERLLTEAVRYLRARVANEAPPAAPSASARPFVQALSDFKQELAATPHEVPEL